jgi:sodium/potassium-transporting ATPase subunit alpha
MSYFNEKAEGTSFAEYPPSTLDEDTITPLHRATTQAGRVIGIQLPHTATRTSAHIPIGFRTLSIQVHESKRYEQPRVKRQEPVSKWRFWKSTKKTTLGNGDDAAFFGSLEYHTLSIDEVSQRVSVTPQIGLDSSAASTRLSRDGPNILSSRKSQLWKKILRYIFGDFCSILWVGVVIFFISWRPLGAPPAPYNLALAILVLLVIFLQAIFSGAQDYSAQKVMQSILTLLPESAVVIRDGQAKSIPSGELVVGDVVQLSTGQKVPADMRIIKASADLKFDKSILTGRLSLRHDPSNADRLDQVNLKRWSAQLNRPRKTS